MLSDYRVLDLSDECGALCGQLLADLGAQVVRVEPPAGSPMRATRRSLAWKVYARNCTSLAIDLATEPGAHCSRALAADADLVIDTGAAARRLYRKTATRQSATRVGVDHRRSAPPDPKPTTSRPT